MDKFRQAMPAMLKHEGIWEGEYIHIDPSGQEIDRHGTRVVCEFPKTGRYAYIQHNTFTWNDGRVLNVTLPGEFRDGKLWWDTETFHGCAWQSDADIVLLDLHRYDDPGARFFEMITLGETGTHRARTWQWFKNGRLFKRTLCNEHLVLRAARLTSTPTEPARRH